jgi:hypothetical protein
MVKYVITWLAQARTFQLDSTPRMELQQCASPIAQCMALEQVCECLNGLPLTPCLYNAATKACNLWLTYPDTFGAQWLFQLKLLRMNEKWHGVGCHQLRYNLSITKVATPLGIRGKVTILFSEYRYMHHKVPIKRRLRCCFSIIRNFVCYPKQNRQIK